MEYYNIDLTEHTKQQIAHFYLYIQYTFMNPLAADSFLKDANNTVKRLSYMADGLPICEDEDLAFFEYRIIHFKKYNFKLLYRIDGDTVIVEAAYHGLQQLKVPKRPR